MNPNEIKELVIYTWSKLKIPDAMISGLEYEDPEIDARIRKMNIMEFNDHITDYDKYYLFCWFSIEFACYYCGGYILFGLSEWFKDNSDEELYDSLAENLYYFVTGQRWPIKEIASHMNPDQIKAVCAFMKLSEKIIGILAILDKTKLLFPYAVVTWELIDMGIDPD